MTIRVCLTALAFLSFTSAQVKRVHLTASGEPRQLPVRILGASFEPFWEHLLDDPAKIAAVLELHLAYTRFPGGTQSNYYDWKRGLFFADPKPDSSVGYRMLAKLSRRVAQMFPEGFSLEQYKAFSDAVGADIVMVPNLETATVADQVEWFRRLAAKGSVPTHIELGNEFWIATGMDPAVLRRWPDEPAAMRIMRQYADAIRAYLPKGAKLAVQAAGTMSQSPIEAPQPLLDRLKQWDDALQPAPWFDAVTIHLYPKLTAALGRAHVTRDALTPAVAERNLRALMTLADEGTDRELRTLAGRLPGKEIWVTEWNPRAAEEITSANQMLPTTPAMLAHLVTRMTMTFLRHPEVRIALYFAPSIQSPVFGPGGVIPYEAPDMFVDEEGTYRALPVALALRWLNESANGGRSFQRYVEAGDTQHESYGAAEGALFRGAGGAAMILQNASAAVRMWKIGEDLKLGRPSQVERLVTPVLAETARHAARVERDTPATDLTLPAYSITRILWDARSSQE